MAAIPLSEHEAIVLESRREIGFDVPYEEQLRDGGRRHWSALLAEGVLVYTVNASIPSGGLPIKLLGDAGNGIVDEYPILTEGESVTVRGHTITVIADDGDAHTVTIAKTDEG